MLSRFGRLALLAQTVHVVVFLAYVLATMPTNDYFGPVTSCYPVLYHPIFMVCLMALATVGMSVLYIRLRLALRQFMSQSNGNKSDTKAEKERQDEVRITQVRQSITH